MKVLVPEFRALLCGVTLPDDVKAEYYFSGVLVVPVSYYQEVIFVVEQGAGLQHTDMI